MASNLSSVHCPDSTSKSIHSTYSSILEAALDSMKINWLYHHIGIAIAAFFNFEKEAKVIEVAVNMNKTQYYMLAVARWWWFFQLTSTSKSLFG